MKLHCTLAFLSLGITVAGCGEAGAPPERPSVLLITVDTLRADHLGAYGYFRATSPGIDALAAEGTVFDRVITTMATTLPAHVSLMTSTHPMTHGIKGNFAHLGDQFGESGRIRSVAEVFAQLGYTTAAFVSAAPLKDHTGIHFGFEHFDQPRQREQLAEVTVERAVRWWNAQTAGEPIFLWVHLWDPHAPYEPVPGHDLFETDEQLLEVLEEVGAAGNPRAAEWHNGYDGEIHYTDAQLQRLFDAARSTQVWDDLAVVLTADHGEGLGQHRWRDHGRIYNEQLHVPLIIKWPASERIAPGRVETLGSLLDVMPTLFGQLDLPIDDALAAQFEGWDLLSPTALAREYLLAERTHRERGWEDGRRYALISDEWKYLYATDGPDRLYSMIEDRVELVDVHAAESTVATEMAAVVEILLAAEREHEQGELSPERAAELRALGYIQ